MSSKLNPYVLTHFINSHYQRIKGRPDAEKLNPIPRFAAAKDIKIGTELFWNYSLVEAEPAKQPNRLKVAQLEKEDSTKNDGKKRSVRLQAKERPNKKQRVK